MFAALSENHSTSFVTGSVLEVFIRTSSCFRIKLKMSHNTAACITALPAAMDALVVEVTKDPKIIQQLDPANEQVLNVIRQTSRPSAVGISLMAGNAR